MFDKRYIHDVFYNQNRLYLIVAAEESLWNVYLIPYEIGCIENPNLNTLEDIHRTKKPFYVRGCPDHRCYLYYIETDYTESVWLSIDNIRESFQVKQYPTFENEFIASTLVKHENNYLPQWIEYHRRMGIQRFVIYDNADTEYDTFGWTKSEIETLHTLSHTHTRTNPESHQSIEETLKPYIEDAIVYIIKWPHPYYLRVSRNSAQATQQNHSLYAFRQAKYIAFFDVDEYLNPQYPYTSLLPLFQDILHYNHMDETNIGSYLLQNRWFYNPFQKHVQGYDFLCIDDTNHITKEGHEKSIVIPANVDIHGIHKTSIAKAILRVSNTLLYFNHYGFLNKNTRAKTFKCIYDNSISRHLRFISGNRPYLGAYLNGGLGNQMFQIATAYSTAKAQRKRLCVNNTLKSSHSSVCYFDNIFRQIEVNNTLPKNEDDLYREPPDEFTQRLNIPYFENDKILWGFFQNEKYFSHNRSEILDLFAADPERIQYLTMKYPDHTNGIFVHYRRTDYLHDKRYNMVTEKYYHYCIRQMREKFPQAIFYIFSDDIAYCQQQTYLIELPYKQFITEEDDVNSLYLMSLCKIGGIGTNSSFSWWGGWLNTNESKMVLYPQQWFDNRIDLDIWWSGCYKMKERPQIHFLTYG